MTARTADEILAKAYGRSTNSMTPVLLSTVLLAPGVAAEVSTSDPQMDLGNTRPTPTLFGVSVALLQPDGTARKVLGGRGVTAPIRSGVFGSRAAAEKHIETMTAYLTTTKGETP